MKLLTVLLWIAFLFLAIFVPISLSAATYVDGVEHIGFVMTPGDTVYGIVARETGCGCNVSRVLVQDLDSLRIYDQNEYRALPVGTMVWIPSELLLALPRRPAANPLMRYADPTPDIMHENPREIKVASTVLPSTAKHAKLRFDLAQNMIWLLFFLIILSHVSFVGALWIQDREQHLSP